MSARLFAGLAALAREEHALVTDERFDELAALDARRDVLMASLPPTAPPEALADLREAARLQGLVTAALRDAREATGAELLRLRKVRTGVQAYAAGTGAPAAPRSAFDAAG
ncbi:MAG TPA: hypothetical protein VK501_28620 [Baekduia sp.]|uniref:hypothetical protein n=1 Tax=Baekduia sp. TaxID=2600305 RepID=UPI002C59B1BF|nr:hypothetical protein [Baekduia sp.]HMJ37907.1 hypothetical protein [Baekduia sp.]